MKQNQVITSRLQVGGRSLSQFSVSQNTKDLIRRPSDALPPPPPQSHPTSPSAHHDESEYEEIDHLPRYTNTPAKRFPGSKKVCSLCGASNPVVSCELCNSQIFCGPCNDMYHRHPKRQHHTRTLLEVVETRPPLPPRSMSISDPPVRPPRRQKKFTVRSTTSSPTSSRKALFDQIPSNFRSQFSIDHRPLPPPPLPTSEPPFQHHDFHRTSFNTLDSRRTGSSTTLHQPSPRNIPLPVLEMSTGARDRWSSRPEEDSNRFPHIPPPSHHPDTMSNRLRAQSASTSQLNKFLNTSANLSHIATLQRKPKRPIVCPPARPPPIPPREFPQQSFHSASAFDLNKISASDHQIRACPNPWIHHHHHPQPFPVHNYPYPPPHDPFTDHFPPSPHQRSSLMKRASSSSSMTSNANNQPVFNPWSSFQASHQFFDEQESPMEFIEFRRGSGAQAYTNHMVSPHPHPSPRPPPYVDDPPPPPPRPLTRESTPRRDSRHPSLFNDRHPHSERETSATPARNPSRWNSPQPFHQVRSTPPPPGSWQCEWCTLLNSAEAKICSVCCKTPSSVFKSSNQSLNSLSSLRLLPSSEKKSSGSQESKRSAPPKPPKSPPPKNSGKRQIKNGALLKSTLSFSRQKEKFQVEKDMFAASEEEDDDSESDDHHHAGQNNLEDDEQDDDDDDDEDPPPNIFPSTPSSSESEAEFLQPRPTHFRSRKSSNKSKRPTPRRSSSSNDEVYGSLPLQTLSIPIQKAGNAPEDNPPQPKRTTSTAVGASPPASKSQFSLPLEPDQAVAIIKQNKNRSSDNSSQESTTKGSSIKPALKKPTTSPPPPLRTTSPVPPHSSPPVEADKITSSKGTSPPPQSISTQTYEQLPRVSNADDTVSKANSTASTAGGSSIENLLHASPTLRSPKEMSDKELRYSRRAQQQSKLKRSMSTHLTSSSNDDPWMDANEGRHLWRSSSRHSLASDTRSLPISGPPSRDSSPPRPMRYHQDFRNFPPPSWDTFPASPADYFASIEGLVSRRRRDSTRHQELELTYLLKEAAEHSFSPEELNIALRMSRNENPVKWLKDNWNTMVETVQTLATNFGREKGDEANDVGTISNTEARDALRLHKGNVWASITDCVEQRRTKFMELRTRGNFLREDILTALTVNHGKLDAAYVDLSKAQLKPFLMHIWGPPIPADNEAAPSSSSRSSGDSNSASNFEIARYGNIPDFTYKHQEAMPHHNNNSHQNPMLQPPPPPPPPSNPHTPFSQNVNNFQNSPTPPGATILSHTGPTLPSTQSYSSQASSTPPPPLLHHLHMDFPLLEVSPDDIPELERMEMEQMTQMDDALPVQLMDNKLHLSMDAVLELLEHQRSKILQEKPAPSPTHSPHTSLQSSGPNFPEVTPNPPPSSSTQSTNQPQPASPLASTSKVSHDDNILESQLSPIHSAPSPIKLPETTPSLPAPPTPATPQPLLPPPPNKATPLELSAKLVSEPGPGSMIASEVLSLEEQEEATQLSPTAPQPPQSPLLPIPLPPASPPKLQHPLAAKSNGTNNTSLDSLPSPASPTSHPPAGPSPPSPHISRPTLSNYAEETPPPPTSADQLLKLVLEIVNPNIPTSGQTPDLPHPTPPLPGDDKSQTSSALQPSGQTFQQVQNDAESTLPILDLHPSLHDPATPQPALQSGAYQIQHPDLYIDDDLEDVDSDDDEDDNYETQSEESSDISGEQVTEQVTQIFIPPPSELGPEPLKKSHPEPLNKMATQVATTQLSKELREMKPTVRRLLESGLSDSFESAELAAQLMDMKFTEEDSVIASKECSSINSALSFLHQECHLCAGKFSAHQMISMLRCTHWCCKTCAKDYFMVQIRDRGILDATCPFCKEPSNLLDESDQAAEYFNHLDILLKNLLEDKYHEMFQRKLRDWALSKTPNFKWCSKCSSGFITEPLQTRLVCPDCSAVTCAVCLEPWDRTHDHPDQKEVTLCDVTKSVVDYLNENSVECPRCRTKFALARGGCMHLTCSTCKFEFCSGCSAAFKQADKCNNGPFCLKLGLHAHHPRNCLFYLRDKDPPFLLKLLQENSIPYLSEQVIDISQTETLRKCHVSIQKETEEGLQDDICGHEAPRGFASVCKGHYVEYLGLLIWQNHLDPVSILSNDDLETIIRRAHKKVPPRPYGTKEPDYRVNLLEVIQNEIPL